MSFNHADYERAAEFLGVPAVHIQAMAAVESAGETCWYFQDECRPPVRFEAHWFGKLTGYRFSASHPSLSCSQWNPALAARTRAGAWGQVERARQLDRDAANMATSWGAFQVMGFHWERLSYRSVQSFVDSMSANGDDGQMDAFARFIYGDAILHRALRDGDWQTVETRYNGGGYGGAYADKLRAAVEVYSGTSQSPRVLRIGDRGPDVEALQRALGVLADGEFGPATQAAVLRVQEDHGLVVDGIVGVMTRSILNL